MAAAAILSTLSLGAMANSGGKPVLCIFDIIGKNGPVYDFARDYAIGADVKPQPARLERTFMGYRRPDGRVATRNYIGVLSSVNCSATAARAIADHFSRQNRPEALADFPNVDGVVALTLYPDEPAKFLKPGGSLQVGRTPARTGTFQTCTYVPAPGTYGLVLYHDENSNGKVDRNGLGIPKEGFGFSNNPSIFFSAPSFKRVRFAVSGPGVAIRIKMKYP